MNNVELEKCIDCGVESYKAKYLYYIYFDEQLPRWTCARHPNYSRNWGCITNPKWLDNLKGIK
jgi:hypothetical protein